MKTMSYVIGRQNPVAFCRNLGVSQAAEMVREETDKIKTSFVRTISFGDRLSQIIEGLIKARVDFSEDDWDGYGAKRIEERSFKNALSFALSLPTNIPPPEIDVEPKGRVLFTWGKGKRQLFSVIVGNMNELSYAGLFGATKTYGVEYLNDRTPDIILDNIDRVYS